MASKSKYKQPITQRSEQAALSDFEFHRQREIEQRKQSVESRATAQKGKRKLTTYEVEMYQKTYRIIGHGEAHGRKDLQEVKNRMKAGKKRGEVKIIVKKKG